MPKFKFDFDKFLNGERPELHGMVEDVANKFFYHLQNESISSTEGVDKENLIRRNSIGKMFHIYPLEMSSDKPWPYYFTSKMIPKDPSMWKKDGYRAFFKAKEGNFQYGFKREESSDHYEKPLSSEFTGWFEYDHRDDIVDIKKNPSFDDYQEVASKFIGSQYTGEKKYEEQEVELQPTENHPRDLKSSLIRMGSKHPDLQGHLREILSHIEK